MNDSPKGAYGADDGLVDFILGITFEIWEQRGIELINQYYGADTVVYGLDGITRGAAQMIAGTRAMLEAYPDRLLLPDNVIWSGSRAEGYYSSHRILSPMINKGPTLFGPATGKQVRILTIADCVVEEGVITLEWLLRDNHALITQLGFDPIECAKIIAERRNAESDSWIASEIARLAENGVPEFASDLADPTTSTAAFALQALANNWTRGDESIFESVYAPYAVAHRSPIELYSGRAAIGEHYGYLRSAIDVSGITVDHVCVQPADSEGLHVAVRWSVTGTHVGEFLGHGATSRPVFVLGATHWRIENDKVAAEWTVFDGLGVLSQLI